MLRLQDVREFEVDKLDMIDCFRPGDLIRATTLGMGDSRRYLLSTAAPTLGVIYAPSTQGGSLQAVSWQLMRCTATGDLERRKVARAEPISAEPVPADQA
eukprot:GHVT01078675.1.p2 GENE.GHVT01078675.1~~GHVT01078675.1.p2  ORF type:complete len:100 (-),score=11.91 GHVT01078675.1:469-768(-)